MPTPLTAQQMTTVTRSLLVLVLVSVAFFLLLWQHPVRVTSTLSSAAQTITSFVFQACSPEDWSSGTWVRRKEPLPRIQQPEDVYKVAGFEGCASNREVEWHLGNDHPDWYEWRGNVSAYDWVPGGKWSVPEDREAMVIDLAENGGWLLVGDSVTQEHFFSLSCLLYPHVTATPDYNGRYDWDRAWPQNMYLKQSSPLVKKISLPEGFDYDKTPLVTFRRVDLLFNRTEINQIQNGGLQIPIPSQFNLSESVFGEEPSWDMSPLDYFQIFLDPSLNYHTMIVSSAGHWSERTFAPLPGGLPGIYHLFGNVVTNWVYQAAKYLDSPLGKLREREVIMRSYLPGDDACHTNETLFGGPISEPQDLTGASYNWEWIPKMNNLSEQAIRMRDHPNIHYLPIERPGRLRPDAHAIGDCLHITVGTGVIEGWSTYIHYFTSTFLPVFRRASRFGISSRR